MKMKIIIDGKDLEGEEGQTILEVAQKGGIEIPTLCHHKGLKPFGGCRLCTVEVKKGKRTQMTTACTTPIEDGIEVVTDSERVLNARKILVELLLARCPNSPEIHELAARMGVARTRFKTLGDPDEKCTLCGLCVRTCNELMGAKVIGFVGRGIERRVAPPFEKLSNVCRACGACEFMCPTGAIHLSDVTDKVPIPIRSEFDEGLVQRPAIYKAYPQAVPNMPMIDRSNCVHFRFGTCGLCEKVCEPKAIKYDQADEIKKVNVGSIVLAPGFQSFDPDRLRPYGYSLHENVVTSLEFERILSATGPYQGTVRRPGDGKTPNKIAFLLCAGSRDKKHDEYCSSVCCMYSIKEAIITKEHSPGVNPTVFYMDIRAFGKEFDYYYERAKEEYGVEFKRAKVGSIEEGENGNLLLHYEDSGEVREEEFDMVVLATPFEPNDLGERLGLELNEYGFIKTDDLSPMSTSRPGIYVAGAAQGPKDIPDTVAQASGAACLASSGIYEGRNSLTIKKELPPEKDVSEEEPRIGVFICHCGINIGGVVDVPEVVGYATKLPNVVYAERNLYTCSSDTQDKIKEMVKEHDLNRVIVASCTPRTHEPLFQATIREAGLNPYLFEFANIRDQCSWIHMHEPEKATEKAKDLVRMAVAKAALLEPLKRERLPVTKSALVIGGGVSGMVSALAIANQEFETYLVEKEKELGGNANRIYSHPFIPDFRERIEELKSKVENHPTIKVFKEAEIADIEGYVGNFKTKIRSGGVESEFEHGVVIVATGAKEHKPKEYLYGKDKKVMTQLELEERLYNGKPLDLSEVVMIQCVGCRNQERGYCSRVCCTGAINNAIEIRKKYPNSKVTVLFKDLRSFGFKEKLYKEASELGVNFVRCGEGMEDPKISYDGEVLKAYDLSLESDLELRPTALVLSSATVPHEENEELAKMLKVPLSRDGFFLEAHMKLRPVDFATDGIFLCGLAHWPKFVDESIAQAYGAASRALTILAKDEIESEGTVAKVDEDLCSGCGVCEVVCPYNAITVDKEEKLSHINPALCKGCGACAAACPSGAIEQLGFETKELMAMIDAEVGR
jgi:heterodisulfide reductase subunit A